MKTVAAVILAVILSAVQVFADSVGESVEVRIISDTGVELPFYPVSATYPSKKVYAEAVNGDHYKISVRNRLNRRVGVVIAVDGRNIISGKKSWLQNSERMYILEPGASYQYAGWRTGSDRINRFYFTESAESYSASFGDTSAMGVIAIAVYPEIQRYEPPVQMMHREAAPRASSPGTSMQQRKTAPSARAETSDRAAGTGYGHAEYSPSHQVVFEPEARSVENLYIKYEWRSALCRMGIIHCGKPYRKPHNRLWDNSGYAPPPGRY